MEVLIPIMALAIPVSFIVMHGVKSVWRMRLEEARVRAQAPAIQASSDLETLEALETEVAELRQELDDVQKRLDFTERLLTDASDCQHLPGRGDAD